LLIEHRPFLTEKLINVKILFLIATVIVSVGAKWVYAQDLTVNILYLEQELDRPALLSSLVVWHEDEGEQGAELGIADNNTTGKFLKQQYTLQPILVPVDGDAVAVAKQALSGGAKIMVINAPGATVANIAALPEAADDLLFNAGSKAASLRAENCAANLLHSMPSRAMLADALMQFLVKRKWTRVFLIEGNREGDKALAQAYRRSAKKFGVKLAHEKQWIADSDLRRSASTEVPVFTQARKYDVVAIADEVDDFGQYVLYNTWLPRPVVGTAGVEPAVWSSVVEQWGAIQLQGRFKDQANRSMNGIDYAAWAAVRSIGEAVTRTKSIEPDELLAYLLSDKFSLAGFKGAKMSFRKWNGQLRQPIPLVHPEAVVALAPLEGFLHQTTELDTLGFDESESKCEAF